MNIFVHVSFCTCCKLNFSRVCIFGVKLLNIINFFCIMVYYLSFPLAMYEWNFPLLDFWKFMTWYISHLQKKSCNLCKVLKIMEVDAIYPSLRVRNTNTFEASLDPFLILFFCLSSLHKGKHYLEFYFHHSHSLFYSFYHIWVCADISISSGTCDWGPTTTYMLGTYCEDSWG